MIKFYDSVADYRRDWLRCGYMGSANSSLNWYGGETVAQTEQLMTMGNLKLVPQAEKLISQLETDIEVPRSTWKPSPAGAFVVVPDFVRGLPTTMRKQTHELAEHEPINILVATTSSAVIDAATLLKRGTAILALTLALSRIRPISLQVFSMLDGHDDKFEEDVRIVRINTSPLDLAMSCYVLTSCGFDRRVSHDIATAYNGYKGGWPMGFSHSDGGQRYVNSLLPRLGFDIKKTLILKPSSFADPGILHPIPWINAQIKRFTESEEQYA